MNPRTLAAWSAAGLVMAFCTANPVYRAIVAVCALNLIAARGRRGGRALLVGIGVAALTSTAVTLLLSHTGVHVLLRIPDGVPALGGPVTLEALAYGLATGLGIAAAMLVVAPLTIVTQPHELVDALPPALARTGAAVGAGLNLIPGAIRSAIEIRDAQRMRGWRAGRIADWPALAVPVVLTAIDGSLTLAEAMEARGYGSRRRTHLAVSSWTGLDTAIAGSAMAGAALLLALRLSGSVPDWYPFPSLMAPAVSLPAVLCCASLALPALLPRR